MSVAFILIGVCWIGLGLLGVVLLVTGIRGRKVNDHPICRACGFDVVGTYPDGETCPECGTSIAAESDIMRGLRERRRGWIALGSLLTLAVLGSLVAVLPGPGVQSLPTAWLHAQAAWLPGPHERAAMNELTRRLEGNLLSQEQIDGIVETVLEHQANDARPWEPASGDFVEAAWENAVIMPETWGTYVQQGFDGWLVAEVRPRVRIGDPIPVRLTEAEDRAARFGSASMYHVSVSADIVVDEFVLSMSGYVGFTTDINDPKARSSTTTAISVDETQASRLRPSRHEAELHLTLGLGRNQYRGRPADTVIERTVVLKLVENGRDTVVPVVPSDVASDVRNSLRPEVSLIPKSLAANGPQWSILIWLDSPPVNLSYIVVARDGEQEWTVGDFAGRSGSRIGVGLNLDDPPDLRSVDLILRPDPAPARGTIDVFEYWNEEIVFRDVEIRRR